MKRAGRNQGSRRRRFSLRDFVTGRGDQPSPQSHPSAPTSSSVFDGGLDASSSQSHPPTSTSSSVFDGGLGTSSSQSHPPTSTSSSVFDGGLGTSSSQSHPPTSTSSSVFDGGLDASSSQSHPPTSTSSSVFDGGLDASSSVFERGGFDTASSVFEPTAFDDSPDAQQQRTSSNQRRIKPMVITEQDLAHDQPIVDPIYDADDRNWVRYRRSWGGILRLLLFAVIVVVAVLWVRTRIYAWVDTQVTPAGPQGPPVELKIIAGSSVNDIAGELQSAGVISNATVFRYWLRCDGELTITGFLGCNSVISVEAGDYVLNENMSFDSVLAVLSEGPAFYESVVFERITIPEGLRWTEIADLLVEKNPTFNRAELESAFASLVDEADYLPEDAEFRTLEGMLFPATYEITPGGLADERGFLKRKSDEFDLRFTRLLSEFEMPDELVDLGLSPYDIVVVASLIQEEALIPEERAKIARVIYNRLAINEALYIDATICYAANKSCADITQADLDQESPWNTRLVKGLPPTPIAAPGEAALRAALQPADGDWLYYVRTDEGGVLGAHHFSVTLDEHNRHVPICRELGYC